MEIHSTVLPIQVGKTVVLARVAATDQDVAGIVGEAKVVDRIPS